jgi:hypothetical protein
MVEAMIEELNKTRGSGSILKTNWKFSGITSEGLPTREESPNILANHIQVDLYLTLNVSSVLKRAKNTAERQSKLTK